jgi:molybdopterin-containing oxidoreductase family membrane subunit
MSSYKAVVGIFDYLDDTLTAIKAAKDGSYDYRVYSPVPRPEIEEATLPGKSNVRLFTMTGAITGCCFGFALSILCSLDYPMRVSAKDIISVPAFFVPGYECTILFGGLATLAGLLYFCKIPDLLRKVGYDPRFSDDKFGVVVGCNGEQVEDVKNALTKSGAIEVQVREGL